MRWLQMTWRSWTDRASEQATGADSACDEQSFGSRVETLLEKHFCTRKQQVSQRDRPTSPAGALLLARHGQAERSKLLGAAARLVPLLIRRRVAARPALAAAVAQASAKRADGVGGVQNALAVQRGAFVRFRRHSFARWELRTFLSVVPPQQSVQVFINNDIIQQQACNSVTTIIILTIISPQDRQTDRWRPSPNEHSSNSSCSRSRTRPTEPSRRDARLPPLGPRGTPLHRDSRRSRSGRGSRDT